MTIFTKIIFLLALLAYVGLSSGAAVRRNVCDGINAKPELYHPYTSSDCPPVNTLNKDGSCGGWKSTYNGCTSFCQSETTFVYGRESPFARSDCHYPLECSISESSSTSYSYGLSISPKVGKALKIGVSGGFSYGTSTAYGRSWSFEPQPGDCGYFTWVPIQKNVCGSLTTGSVITLDPTDPNPIEICDPNPVINASFCESSAWNLNGAPDGVVIFVYTDCRTRAPLGPEQQDPTYNQPGVALRPETIVALQETWSNSTCTINSRWGGPDSGDMDFIDFTIQGAGLNWEDIADNGSGLETELATCGTMLNTTQAWPWNFTWTPNDPDFDFVAVGTLYGIDRGESPTTNCVGDVVAQFGGPDKGECQGWQTNVTGQEEMKNLRDW